jgi:hypothetical protein
MQKGSDAALSADFAVQVRRSPVVRISLFENTLHWRAQMLWRTWMACLLTLQVWRSPVVRIGIFEITLHWYVNRALVCQSRTGMSIAHWYVNRALVCQSLSDVPELHVCWLCCASPTQPYGTACIFVHGLCLCLCVLVHSCTQLTATNCKQLETYLLLDIPAGVRVRVCTNASPLYDGLAFLLSLPFHGAMTW